MRVCILMVEVTLGMNVQMMKVLCTGKLVDASAPVNRTESNMLHKFEQPISVSLAELQSFGGPGVLISEGSWLGNNNHNLTH